MSPGEYRENAARCMALAEQLSDGSVKESMLGMAAVWLRLADQAEKYLVTDIAYDWPPASPPIRPVVQQLVQQQQQQIQSKQKK